MEHFEGHQGRRPAIAQYPTSRRRLGAEQRISALVAEGWASALPDFQTNVAVTLPARRVEKPVGPTGPVERAAQKAVLYEEDPANPNDSSSSAPRRREPSGWLLRRQKPEAGHPRRHRNSAIERFQCGCPRKGKRHHPGMMGGFAGN